MLLDHLAQSRDRSQQAATAIALTGHDNEPFVVHLMELRGRHGDVAVSIREIGTDISAFKDRYHLSRREIQVAELVLRGYRNSHIARDARDHAGDDQEASVPDLRESRRRFAGPACQQAGLTAVSGASAQVDASSTARSTSRTARFFARYWPACAIALLPLK